MFELDELVGLRVGQISFGSGVTLDLRGYADRSDVTATLDAGPIRYESADGSTVELDALETRGIRYAPLLALYGSEIKAARQYTLTAGAPRAHQYHPPYSDAS